MAGFVKSLVHMGMRVDIKDTADFVEAIFCAPIRRCLLPSLLDQSQRRTSEISKLELRLLTADGTQILPLRDLALSEYADNRALFLETGSGSPVFGRFPHLRSFRVKPTSLGSRPRPSNGVLELNWIQRRDAAVAPAKVPSANGLVAPNLEVG